MQVAVNSLSEQGQGAMRRIASLGARWAGSSAQKIRLCVRACVLRGFGARGRGATRPGCYAAGVLRGRGAKRPGWHPPRAK